MRLHFFYSAVRANSKLDLSNTEGAIESVRIKVAPPSILKAHPPPLNLLYLNNLRCKTILTSILHID